MASALISSARRAAAVSVEKYGWPVPPARMIALPFSRWRIARRRMYGSAIADIGIAVMTRVCKPIFSSASCNAIALIAVPSMPI